jgi:hypothetical protein
VTKSAYFENAAMLALGCLRVGFIGVNHKEGAALVVTLARGFGVEFTQTYPIIMSFDGSQMVLSSDRHRR